MKTVTMLDPHAVGRQVRSTRKNAHPLENIDLTDTHIAILRAAKAKNHTEAQIAAAVDASMVNAVTGHDRVLSRLVCANLLYMKVVGATWHYYLSKRGRDCVRILEAELIVAEAAHELGR